VPLNRQVAFTLQSKDVLHDFWVPAFRMKKDAVPGIDVKYSVTPNKLGTYEIVCAELCGLGHAVMRSTAVVEQPEAFETWVADLGKPPKPAAGATPAAPADGKAIFTSQEANCASCHTLADAGADGTIGPDLDDVLADKDEAFIKESIADPDKVIADGYQSGIMPGNYAQTLPQASLDALAKYLSEVTKGG
jgi:cytochrome c oxidase subunit 2